MHFLKRIVVCATVFLLILAFTPFYWLKPLFDALSIDGDFSLLTSSTIVIFRSLFIAVAFILFVYYAGELNQGRMYALLLAFLYSAICSAQVLGFFRIYRLGYILPIVSVGTVILFFVYDKYWTRDFHASVFHGGRKPHVFDSYFWALGMFLMILLILLPLILWPYSSINPVLAWDVGKYHLPKALELANTGSAWDMTISYGEYPYGYESLFAFVSLLTRDGMLFGTVHALGVLFFVLTFWLLLCRYTSLPAGLNFLLVVCLLISGLVWRNQISNIWSIYHIVLYDTIGKNDLFLAASVLAVLLHAPVNTRLKEDSLHLPGMAMATMIALSVKPNSVFVIILIWSWTIFQLLRDRQGENRGETAMKFFGYGLLVLPGGLWVLRNLMAQGSIFSSVVLRLQSLSILNNLSNPGLYAGISATMVISLVVLIISFVMTLHRKHFTWIYWMVLFILFFSFISTPASGFVRPTSDYAIFSWRFGVAFLTFMFITIVIMIEPWLVRVDNWLLNRPVPLRLILFAITGGLALLVAWNNRWYFLPTFSNANVLVDQYARPVGVDGYNSAFDYIYKNVRHSVVWVENGLPFYAYGPGFTNSTTLLARPDYIVILQTAWPGNKKPGYPPKLASSDWMAEWQLVYEDPEGRVYHHK